MKWINIFLILISVSFFTVADDDLIPPVLENFEVVTKSVDVTDASQQIVVTFRVTDESGIETPHITAGSTINNASTGFGVINLTSGDSTDGTYQAILTVPHGSTSGEWRVSLFPLEDTVGNGTSFLPGAEFDATFTVTSNESDLDAPVLESFEIVTKSVDVTGASQQIIVTFRVTDESGIETPHITAGSTINSASTGFGVINLTSGDSTDGTYQAILTVPHGSTSGEWRVSLFPLEDTVGNGTSFLPGAEFDSTFTVVKSGDKSNNVPVIEFDDNLSFEENIEVTITPVVTDSDLDELTYEWEQTTGHTVTIDDYYATSLVFTAHSVGKKGDYLGFKLTVNDGKDYSVANITVNILNINQAPVVSITTNANYDEEENVTLTANASDADEDSLEYAWSQVSGPILTIDNDSSRSASFIAPDVTSDTNVVIKVVVNDGFTETSSEKTIVIKDKKAIDNSSSDEGGGGSIGYLILALLLITIYRKIDFIRYN